MAKNRLFMQKALYLVLCLNFVLALAACNLNLFKGESVKLPDGVQAQQVIDLLFKLKLSEGEKADVIAAVSKLRKFQSDWQFAAVRITADGSDFELFKADFSSLMKSHELVKSIVEKHNAEFTDDQLAELSRLSAAFAAYAIALEGYSNDLESYQRKKEIAIKVVENLPKIAVLFGIKF